VEQTDKIAFSLFGLSVALCILGVVFFYNRKRRRQQGMSRQTQRHTTKNKSRRQLDCDAFLDEYESSNDHLDSEQEGMGMRSFKSKSFSDFEASEEEFSEDEDGGMEGYDESEGEDESYESSEDEKSYESPEEVASPLYSDPDTPPEIL